jgi:peptidoglycan/xylan/chitin deacetylase (PgdA/CDA1 family)
MTSDGGRPVRDPLRNRTHDAVFLAYHSVADRGPAWSSVPVEQFERQLDVLARWGYRGAGTRELEQLAAGRRPERPWAFLTFDDGFADNASTMAPLLNTRGWTGMVFLLPPAADSGAPFDWPEIQPRRESHPQVMRSLDWAAVESMADAGIEFGSHTNRHLHLPALGDEELRDELLDSRRRITSRLGRCDSLAYPFGEWDSRVAAAARDAGYRFAFTLPRRGQAAADLLSIPRVAVDHRDDRSRFALKLSPVGRGLVLSPARTWTDAVRSRGYAVAERRPAA